MQNFSLNIKTRIYFGTNITGDALAKEADNISGNIMIVTTGRSLERYGYVKQPVSYTHLTLPTILLV